ncbi:MAG: hypothetical protein JWR80_1590 [Bradyrhizobium sp.]|nr:hypothetical protein [Bradyrhizobium sp.]
MTVDHPAAVTVQSGILFLSGSRSISRLSPMFEQRLANALSVGLHIVVGDAYGADAAMQTFLAGQGARRVTVHCSGRQPRHNVGGWSVQTVDSHARAGSRAFFAAKDVVMARSADFGLMLWDGESTGTLNNLINLLGRKCISVVHIAPAARSMVVADIAGLDRLLSFMPARARDMAEATTRRSATLERLRLEQHESRRLTI